MKNVFTRTSEFAALLLIFLAMFVPTSYVPLKAAMLVLMCVGIISASVLNGNFWNKGTVISIVLVSSVGLLNSLHGSLSSNPGAIPTLTIWVAWPLVYLFATALLINNQSFRWIVRVLFLSMIAIVLYTMVYLGKMASIVPEWMYIELDMGQDINADFVEYALYNITSLMALIPFAATFAYIKNPVGAKNKIIIYVLLMVCFAVVVLSGRRALQINFFLVPIFTFVSISLLSKIDVGELVQILSYWSIKMVGVISIFLALATLYFGDFIDAIFTNVAAAYDLLDSGKESERVDQLYSLVEGWVSSPLRFFIGWGNGASADVIRSVETPWAYELTYVYLLFSTGLIGTLFYFGWFTWGLMRLRRVMLMRPDLLVYVAPLVSGVLGLCVAAVTNPYFGKFDYLWLVLLPHLLVGGVKYQAQIFKRSHV